MSAQEAAADKIIALIYAAAHAPAKWLEVVRAIRDHFGAHQACFVRFGPNATSADQIRAKENPYYDELYFREFANDVNFLTKVLVQLPIGEVYSELNHINIGKLKDERFWKEWLEPQDMYHPMGAKLYSDGTSTWFFSIDRGQKDEAFGTEEMARFRRFIPHFVNAIRMGLDLAARRAPSVTLSQVPLGIIVTTQDQRILYANDFAEQILARSRSPLSRSAAGQLITSDRNKASDLAAAIESVASDEQEATNYLLLESRHSDDPDYAAAVAPLGKSTDIFAPGGQALLTIRELAREAPQDFDQQLRMLFNLSAQEARVAAKLAFGQTVKEVAESLEIGLPTVRSHLASLFRKTRTAQQSQLVALLRASIA